MEIFTLTLQQMLMMFMFISVGYLLRKKRILPENSDLAFSRLQFYVFSTALNTYAMMDNCTVETFKDNAYLILWGLGIIVVMILLSYPLSRLFIPNYKENAEAEYKCDVYKYALAFSNYSYLGSFLVLNLWGSEGLFKYTMFKLTIDILCNTWGLFVLIPKNHNTSFVKNLLKGVLTPPIIGMFLGMILGLLDVTKYIPGFVITALGNASNCLGPMAMIISGFVIAGYELKGLFLQGRIYVASLFRLLILPALLLLILRFLNVTNDLMIFALVGFAAPIGMNTIVYPATFGGEPYSGASMVLISSIFAIITMPLMFMLFVG